MRLALDYMLPGGMGFSTIGQLNLFVKLRGMGWREAKPVVGEEIAIIHSGPDKKMFGRVSVCAFRLGEGMLLFLSYSS